MSRQIAQFLWVGPGLAPLESACIRSFVEVGYEVHLYAYDALNAVPDGVTMKDANEILDRDKIFLGAGTNGGSYAPFADRFRYHLLYKKGGWWFDTDHFAISLLPEPKSLRVSSQWEGVQGQYANVGAIWCVPGDPKVGWLKDTCEEILESGQPLEYTQLGPGLMNEMIKRFECPEIVAPWWEFCPYPYNHMDRIVYKTTSGFVKDKAKFIYHMVKQLVRKDIKPAYIRPQTRAVHVWNEIWRANGLDKHALYHPWSLYGRLQRRYAVDSNIGGTN